MSPSMGWCCPSGSSGSGSCFRARRTKAAPAADAKSEHSASTAIMTICEQTGRTRNGPAHCLHSALRVLVRESRLPRGPQPGVTWTAVVGRRGGPSARVCHAGHVVLAPPGLRLPRSGPVAAASRGHPGRYVPRAALCHTAGRLRHPW
eukprot:4672508-Prymnesium_polylepis.1